MRLRNEPEERVAIRHDYVRKHVAQVVERRRVPNRVAMRRQYLCKKANAYSLAASRFLFWLVFLAGAALAGIPLLNSLHKAQYLAAVLVFITIFGTGTALAIRRGKTLADKAKQEVELYYSPPVEPQTLPEDEVLLRSSNALSTAHNDHLLIPANHRPETSADNLLRAASPEIPSYTVAESHSEQEVHLNAPDP